MTIISMSVWAIGWTCECCRPDPADPVLTGLDPPSDLTLTSDVKYKLGWVLLPGVGAVPFPNQLWADQYKAYNLPLTFCLNCELPSCCMRRVEPQSLPTVAVTLYRPRSFTYHSGSLAAGLPQCGGRPVLVSPHAGRPDAQVRFILAQVILLLRLDRHLLHMRHHPVWGVLDPTRGHGHPGRADVRGGRDH